MLSLAWLGGRSWLLCWRGPRAWWFSPAEGEVPLADAPDVWSDGSLVLDGFSGIGVAGCGVYAHGSGAAWFGRQWGTWICFLHYLMVLVRLVDCIVLFLALCRLCSELRFGEF